MRRDVKFDGEKAMRRSLEQELRIPPEVELMALKDEPHSNQQDIVEQPHMEE